MLKCSGVKSPVGSLIRYSPNSPAGDPVPLKQPKDEDSLHVLVRVSKASGMISSCLRTEGGPPQATASDSKIYSSLHPCSGLVPNGGS